MNTETLSPNPEGAGSAHRRGTLAALTAVVRSPRLTDFSA